MVNNVPKLVHEVILIQRTVAHHLADCIGNLAGLAYKA
jgi:hypothetical protein